MKKTLRVFNNALDRQDLYSRNLSYFQKWMSLLGIGGLLFWVVCQSALYFFNCGFTTHVSCPKINWLTFVTGQNLLTFANDNSLDLLYSKSWPCIVLRFKFNGFSLEINYNSISLSQICKKNLFDPKLWWFEDGHSLWYLPF